MSKTLEKIYATYIQVGFDPPIAIEGDSREFVRDTLFNAFKSLNPNGEVHLIIDDVKGFTIGTGKDAP